MFLWNSLAFRFSMYCYCQITSVMSDSVWPHPWDSPGKKTGVGCHFLLQCIKMKSESDIAQSCLTLHDPMDCSLPGSSIHGIFQAKILEWGAIAFSFNIYRCWILSFLHFLELLYGYFPLFCPLDELHWLILKYENNPAFLD